MSETAVPNRHTVFTVGCDFRSLDHDKPNRGATLFQPAAWQGTEEDAVRAVETHFRLLDPSAGKLTLEVFANVDRSLLCVDVRTGEGAFAILASYRIARVVVDAGEVEGSPAFGIVQPKPAPPVKVEGSLLPQEATIRWLKGHGCDVQLRTETVERAKSQLARQFCPACGQPATVATIDIKEGEPSFDPSGQGWRTWQPDGETRYSCEQHEIPTRRRYRDGRVEQDRPASLVSAEVRN